MKKRRVNQGRKAAPAKDAWAAAAAHGVNMKLLEESLRRTPQERIDFNQMWLNRIQQLRADAKQVFVRATRLGLL